MKTQHPTAESPKTAHPQRKQATRALSHLHIKDEDRLLFASLIIVLAAFLVINATYVAHHWSQEDTVGSTATILTAQQHANTPAFFASISHISEDIRVDPAFTLADGETMLIMNLTIANNSAIDQNFIPSTQLYIRTQGGDYRPLHPSMFVTNQIFSGTLKPHQEVSGQISFGVPKTATNPLLYIDTGWLDQTPTVFSTLK